MKTNEKEVVLGMPNKIGESNLEIEAKVHIGRTAIPGAILSINRQKLVMEIFNLNKIIKIDEKIDMLSIIKSKKNIYSGMAIVENIVDTGMTNIVSINLMDYWCKQPEVMATQLIRGNQASTFVETWRKDCAINDNYKYVINEFHGFLGGTFKWIEQQNLNTVNLNKKIMCDDNLDEIAAPLIRRIGNYFCELEEEAKKIDPELAAPYRAFCQANLHPAILRAPFVFRAYTKPLGYAGDYKMVNQINDDPWHGPNTYFKIINTAFLRSSIADAHRNRIDILYGFLVRMAERAQISGKKFHILNVGCGPAIEIQRFMKDYKNPEWLSFELIDFNSETLEWTRNALKTICEDRNKPLQCDFVLESVHNLLKRQMRELSAISRRFDAVYCAGLFDYLSDKICIKLVQNFSLQTVANGEILVTNVHSNFSNKYALEHILEWYLNYRDEQGMERLLPFGVKEQSIYVDATGVNIFMEAKIS